MYRLFLLLMTPAILLFILLRSKSNTAYRLRLKERFGFLNKQYKQHGIVVHAASVGEVLALKSFVEQLLIKYPDTPITFTTFTPTGSEQVTKLFGPRVQHCYLPLDIFFATQLFLKKLKPQTIIFMETELWPNLVAQASSQNIKLLLINGRISSSSINSYKRLKWLIAPCLQRFDKILSQSEDNQDNLMLLGALPDHCIVSGNLKYDMLISSEITQKKAELSCFIPQDKMLWVMASTHQGDEEIVFDAFNKIKNDHPNIILTVVPRHPERFDQVITLAKRKGFNTCVRSKKDLLTEKSDVWVIDTLGELIALYGLAEIVTIGGSFSGIGGHNPLEPAWFKKPIIVGPNMANFSDIMQQMLKNNALVQLDRNTQYCDQLSLAVSDLLHTPHKATVLGGNANQVVLQNKGAVARTLTELAKYIHV